MRYLERIEDIRTSLAQARTGGRRIGFVPTMGALHEGHRSLMRAARAACGEVVVSIFVNPTQFGPHEDFERYPRPLEADLAACEEERADLVFGPSVAEIYPFEPSTAVLVPTVSEGLCGASRPGHFQGVATVVAKLLNIVQPDAAYFGQKDYQQTVVLRRMVRDLCWPIELVVCPTVREPDGLALSSRNAYLSPQERTQARCLYAALSKAREQIALGIRAAPQLVQNMRNDIESAGPCRIEYIEIVDADDLSPKSKVEGRCVLALAVRIGHTRLIDNVLVDAR